MTLILDKKKKIFFAALVAAFSLTVAVTGFSFNLSGYPVLNISATIECGANMSCSQAGTTLTINSLGVPGANGQNGTNGTNGINGTNATANSGYFRQFWQKQGKSMAGTWAWEDDPSQTYFSTVTNEVPGFYSNYVTHLNLDTYAWNNTFLGTGQYNISYIGYKSQGNAIVEVLINNDSLGSIDNYNLNPIYNYEFVYFYNVTSAGLYNISIRANGKNASNPFGYYVRFSTFKVKKIGEI